MVDTYRLDVTDTALKRLTPRLLTIDSNRGECIGDRIADLVSTSLNVPHSDIDVFLSDHGKVREITKGTTLEFTVTADGVKYAMRATYR